jgi:predicted metal-binding membrane protein
MALLFVGGVMNLAWVAALSLLVLLEKVIPGRWISVASGAALLGWGLYLLAGGLMPAG